MVSCDPPVEAFVQYVKDQRSMDEDNMELITGLDDGNGSTKVSVFLNYSQNLSIIYLISCWMLHLSLCKLKD